MKYFIIMHDRKHVWEATEWRVNEGVLYFCLFRTLKYQAPAGQYRANLFVTENIECLSMWKGLYNYPFVCNTLQIYPGHLHYFQHLQHVRKYESYDNCKIRKRCHFGHIHVLRQNLRENFHALLSTHLAAFRGVIYYPPFNLKSIRACRITRIVESVFLLRHFRWRRVRHGCVKIQQKCVAKLT
jgi:hypothetical protein